MLRISTFFAMLLLARQSTSFAPTMVGPSDRHVTARSASASEDRDCSPLQSRKTMLISSASSLLSIGASLLVNPSAASAVETITACPKPAGGSGGGSPAKNCISTASVKQLDLYMPPWTFPDNISIAEAMARLKGAISEDLKLSIEEQTETFLRVKAIRGFSTDEIKFLFNAEDRVITFNSQQIDGLGDFGSQGDFGAQRKRLEEVKQRSKIFKGMGEEFATSDTAPREGKWGQLKAFYGVNYGTGYEDIVLGED
jgi:uncharacterized protein (DUF1499 family)